MCPMSPKGSLGSRIFLSRASSCAAATSPAGAALSVGGAVAAGVWPPTPFMISATPSAADRSTCIFATPHIAVWPVVALSLPISPTSPRSRASTPTGCNRRPCDWWEKALTFLDDKLLPATSNAVERSNRRYRKAQKSIYSVRTAEHIRQRIALDMQRDQQAPDRAQTTKALHQARSGTKKPQE